MHLIFRPLTPRAKCTNPAHPNWHNFLIFHDKRNENPQMMNSYKFEWITDQRQIVLQDATEEGAN